MCWCFHHYVLCVSSCTLSRLSHNQSTNQQAEGQVFRAVQTVAKLKFAKRADALLIEMPTLKGFEFRPFVGTSYVCPNMVYSVCPNNEIKSNNRNWFAVSCILAIVSSSKPKSKCSIAPQVLSQTRDLSTLRFSVQSLWVLVSTTLLKWYKTTSRQADKLAAAVANAF